ncbi:MAG: glycosyltransferase family 4 protein [Lachnospiraceae bacterium]|nr:glycosyltransferase family 4 protein [Lachnospiraceae bacterium]
MNILMITHEKNLGGASKSLIVLASELQERGHTVIVVTPFCFGSVYNELRKNGIKVYGVLYAWWMMSIDWNIAIKIGFKFLYHLSIFPILKLEKIVKKHNIQIIHSNSSVVDIGARVADRMGIRHVWHFREFAELYYHMEYLQGKKKSFEFLNRVNGRIVFISKNLRDYFSADIRQDLCQVIYNGIAETYLIDKYSSILDKKEKSRIENVRFLIAGNFHRNKRHDLVIQAFYILQRRGYKNFKLIIAGAIAANKDSQNYEQGLRKMAEEKIPDKVEFRGFVEDMISLRKCTDVEIVASNLEAFGRVTAEAMMASNPVIGSKSGATPELIEEGKNGLLFEQGNAEDLADKIEFFLKNTVAIQEYGSVAYAYAKEHFVSKKNTENVENLYCTLIDSYKMSGGEVKGKDK